MTYDKALTGTVHQAIIETAERFIAGEVDNHNPRFAPSVAEFAIEARRIAELLPYRGIQSLPAPTPEPYCAPDPAEKTRVGFKMMLWAASHARGHGTDSLAEALTGGLESLIALAERWHVPISDELRQQVGGEA